VALAQEYTRSAAALPPGRTWERYSTITGRPTGMYSANQSLTSAQEQKWRAAASSPGELGARGTHRRAVWLGWRAAQSGVVDVRKSLQDAGERVRKTGQAGEAGDATTLRVVRKLSDAISNTVSVGLSAYVHTTSWTSG